VGLGRQQVLELVCATLRAEHEPIVRAIFTQIEDYAARGFRPPDGSTPVHGFVNWLWGLQDGRWSLPEELPEDWLLAWRNGYAPYYFSDGRRPWCPHPWSRCEDCRMGLPCTDADGRAGEGGGFRACPVCEGRRISSVCFFDMRLFSLDGGITRHS
jgi:hypothetical protein